LILLLVIDLMELIKLIIVLKQSVAAAQRMRGAAGEYFFKANPASIFSNVIFAQGNNSTRTNGYIEGGLGDDIEVSSYGVEGLGGHPVPRQWDF